MANQLGEPITVKGVRSTFFFNGRLLAAGDMQAEQAAASAYRQQLGAAIGSGVISGLEVSIAGSSGTIGGSLPDTLAISAGSALTDTGQMLVLPQDTSVVVATGIPPGTATGGDFMYCEQSQPTPVATSTGIHLLLMSAASEFEGYAPLSGLGAGGAISGCGRKYVVDGVQLRLAQLNLPTTSEIPGVALNSTFRSLAALKDATNLAPGATPPSTDVHDLSMLRNRLAYLCFGPPSGDLFARLDQPFPSQYDGVTKLLADARQFDPQVDVPLALIYWTARGLRFVDMGSVRRSPVPPLGGDPWAALLYGRRAHEGEAMALQFAEQLAWLRTTGEQLVGHMASEYFRYLPPVGLVPLASSAFPQGFHPDLFFDDIVHHPIVYIEGARLEALAHAAVHYPPIDVTSKVMVWIYLVRENQQTSTVQPYLVFTSGHMAYLGDPHYDVNRWDYSNLG